MYQVYKDDPCLLSRGAVQCGEVLEGAGKYRQILDTPGGLEAAGGLGMMEGDHFPRTSEKAF